MEGSRLGWVLWVVLVIAVGLRENWILTEAVELEMKLSSIEEKVVLAVGLDWNFYSKTCPRAEGIVGDRVAAVLRKDVTAAAGLLRLFFHDCFVQGCDASILIRDANGELTQAPNLSIRQSALAIVDDIKASIEAVCKNVVSCADVVVLAARESVKQVGGPSFNVPLGRRDSLTFAPGSVVLGSLPNPLSNFATLQAAFKKQGLDDTDLVTLSGGHTIGIAHCASFTNRLRPAVDPKLNRQWASYLTSVCPTNNSPNSTNLDFFSPNKFDNVYYQSLLSSSSLLTSDQSLDQNSAAWNLVKQYSSNQSAFFNSFLWSFVKMSQLSPLTGNAGQIRSSCSVINRVYTSVQDEVAVTDLGGASEDLIASS